MPAPVVTSVNSAAGPEAGGTEVKITITEVAPSEVTAVDFGMAPASFFANNEGSITASAPAGSGDVDVTVTAFGGTSLTSFADQFSYVPAPTVTAVDPETGPPAGGTTVTITGTNLADATAVDFGSSGAASFVVESPNSITAVSPHGTPGETTDVTVTTAGGTSSAGAADHFRFLQTEPLRVKSVAPDSGALVGGTPVTIRGSGFVGATAVDFGASNAASFTVDNGRTISAVAPAGTGTVDVTVTTPEGVSPTSFADQFSYVTSPPQVEKVSPAESSESGGRKIAVKGVNFTGATEVRFGSIAANSFVVNDKGTVITAVDPSAELDGKTTVDVTVTTPEGTSAVTAANRFTYKLRPPIVTRLSTHGGPAAGGTTVVIIGTGLVEPTAVDFGSVPATSFSSNTDGSVTATSPAEMAGRVLVTVTTSAGRSGPGECTVFPEEGSEKVPCPHREEFTFAEPTVTSVSPSAGSTAGGTPVTITGTGFGVGTTATSFHFGKTTLATSVECTSITTCTAVTPAHPMATVDVKVEVGASGSHTNPPADHFTYG